MQFVKKNEILKEREMTSKDSGLIFSITVISMFIASLAFVSVLGALAAEDYHDRCLAVHLLDALGMHKTRVLRALRERLLCETVPAVRTTIEDVLRAEEEKNV